MKTIGVALARIEATDEARETLRLAKEAAEATDLGGWTVHLLTEIALARASVKEQDAALEDLEQLWRSVAKVSMVQEQVRAWGDIAVAQRRLGRGEAAKATLRTARQAVEGCQDATDKLNAQVHLVENLSTIGEFDLALDLIAAVPPAESNLKDPLLRQVIKVADASGRATALPVLKRAAEIASTITYEVPKATTQMSLAPAIARAGDLEGALRMARAIGRDNVLFDDRDSIPLALAPIALVQAKAGDRDGARAILLEALEIATGLQEGEIRAERLRRVAEALAEFGDPDGAAVAASRIASPYEQSYAYLAIARARAKLAGRKGATEAFRRAIEAAEAAPQGHNTDWSLNKIVEGQATAGDVAGAIATALGHGDDPWKACALTDIATIRARAGDVVGASKTAESIRDPFYRPIVMKVIAAARARTGDLADSIDWANRLDPPARVQALAGIAQQASLRKAEGSKALFGGGKPEAARP